MREPANSICATVLVVDDEESIRNIARLTLERSGFAVLVARDGAEAVNIFRDHAADVDVVLADMTLPGLDGAEICRQVHQIAAHVPVLLSSGFDHSVRIKDYRGAGPVTFLPKPYRPKELVDTLKNVLALVKRDEPLPGVEQSSESDKE